MTFQFMNYPLDPISTTHHLVTLYLKTDELLFEHFFRKFTRRTFVQLQNDSKFILNAFNFHKVCILQNRKHIC